MLPHHTPEPQLRENDTAPQYTADSDRDGTYRLWDWLQAKTKLEEELNDIVVSEPYVITGFIDKINNLLKKNYLPPNLQTQNEYPKTPQNLELPALKPFSLSKWGASGREAEPVPDPRGILHLR